MRRKLTRARKLVAPGALFAANGSMASSDTTIHAEGTAPSRTSRLKPRASARTQLLLAGGVWYLGAAILGIRGLGWLGEADLTFVLIAIAVALGATKARYVLRPVTSRTIARIQARGRDECAGGFLSWQSWLLVVAMVGIGYLLRLTPIPHAILGVLYVAVAVALVLAGRRYFTEAFRPDVSRPGL
jgi:hypothetical protein